MNFFENKITKKLLGECNNNNGFAKAMYQMNVIGLLSLVLLLIYDFYFMMTTTGFELLNLFREIGFFLVVYGILRVSYKRLWANLK